MPLEYQPCGDCAVRVVLGADAAPATLRRVRAFCHVLAEAGLDGVSEWVPGYATVTVFYRPERVRYAAVCARLRAAAARAAKSVLPSPSLLSLPVCYGGTFGPDLGFVAEHAKLAPGDVTARHAARIYLVHFIGFTPGFPYLSGLDPQLATPRLERPRISVPAGSVGIAGAQTGVYPQETPGGWRIIGRTPVKLFEARRVPPVPVGPGDTLRFRPVDEAEFRRLDAQVAAGAYKLELALHGGADG